MNNENIVRILPSEVSTSASIIRAHLAAAVAYSRRDPNLARLELGNVAEELSRLQDFLLDNPSKG